MLKLVYMRILRTALDEPSYNALREVVDDAGLFSMVDEKTALHTCYSGCEKNNSCSTKIRYAIDEIYRYYFEVCRVIHEVKLQEGKAAN